ncbi:hypothetical protein N7G274_000733 [Stereocaulon virgatum]|uniref:Uncharacterized protein n=1 Tax=Stereocaulon virgatum TaxID=373712 RepID=A0ABR4AS68_9LECA
MARLVLTLVLCSIAHSLVIKPPSADQIMIPPEVLTTCAHNEYTDLAVVAWPGDSCAAAARNLPETTSTTTAYPLSCPPLIANSKCFPITEPLAVPDTPDSGSESSPDPNPNPDPDPEAQAQLELRRRTHDPAAPSPTAYVARSVSLKWPDRMTHALFFDDRECQTMDTGVHAWHVERAGLRAEQCVDLSELEGRFGSVEFMRREEWEVWTERRRGRDGDGGWGWKGLL